ncbi:unnamed protein product [Tenebrio molitor]|nr:unnamed protein product [Tenebrio molitor]
MEELQNKHSEEKNDLSEPDTKIIGRTAFCLSIYHEVKSLH